MMFIKAYVNREYPAYILRDEIVDEIPAFIFHHVKKDEFEDCLNHLKRNGYHTLTADQFEAALVDRAKAPEKSVLITFDDGLDDVYNIAYPLLEKYQLQAVVFLIVNWMGNPGIITWDQAKEMHEKKIIDFQSHSMNHPAIFTSPQIIDFYRPAYSGMKRWNIPLTHFENGGQQLTELSYGIPLYEYSSRFSDHKRFVPDDKIQKLCVDYVRQHGTDQFFNRKDWRKILLAIIYDYKIAHHESSRYESEDEQVTDIFEELDLSSRTIQSQLPGKVVRHFAYPWNEVGLMTTNILEKCGYKTAFTGMVPNQLKIEESRNIRIIRRVSGDFIKCLSGEGRQSFWSVLLSKMIRRLKNGATY